MPVTLIPGTNGDDTISSSQDRDLIYAYGGDDWIILNGGRDTVHGAAGDDSVFGYFGGDHLYGGDGNDQLVSSGVAGAAAGYLYGGDGDDALFTGDDPDQSYGGAGNDRITIYRSLGGSADGGTGVDRLVLIGLGQGGDGVQVTLFGAVVGGTARAGTQSLTLTGFEALTLSSGAGADIVGGGNLDDVIDVAAGANRVQAVGGDDLVTYRTGEANVLDGGTGTDTLRVVHHDQAVGLVFAGLSGVAVDGFGSALTGFERWQVVGGNAADDVTLGHGRDRFQGLAGQDHALGMSGRDRLDGGAGRDVLIGGFGKDVLIGGTARDALTGGRGADVFVFQTATDLGDRITDFATGQDQIRLERAALGAGLEKGPLDHALFHLDAAVGVGGQFILRAAAGAGFRDLIWDGNGTLPGAEVLVVQISATATLAASDLLIV